MSLSPKQARGRTAESLACQFLTKQGLVSIKKNFLCRLGEIDLIMQDNRLLVFVEVRYRSSIYPEQATIKLLFESIGPKKQQCLIGAAQYFLKKHAQYTRLACRFDAIFITGPLITPKTDSILWIKDAFQLK